MTGSQAVFKLRFRVAFRWVSFGLMGIVMRARECWAAARKAQKRAAAETDPQLKAEYSRFAEQWTEIARTADVLTKLNKAIAAAAKKGI